MMEDVLQVLAQLNSDELRDLVLTKRVDMITINDGGYRITLKNGTTLSYNEDPLFLIGLFCEMNDIGWEYF